MDEINRFALRGMCRGIFNFTRHTKLAQNVLVLGQNKHNHLRKVW